MAIEDSLAKLQSVVDEVVAEVKQAVSDIVGSPAAPAETAPAAEAPTAPAEAEAPAEPVAPEGTNVAQQDVVPPAPTTEPPAEDEAATVEEPAPDAAG